jgi:hypothetical protein
MVAFSDSAISTGGTDVKKIALGLGAVALCLSSTAAFADEGMWTFDNFPAATIKAKYGVAIDRKWLDHLRAASVRLPGCSASIVSKDGLVLTNHHCVRTCAQNLSTGKVNYVEDGFFARDRKDEKLCPGMTAEILSKSDDVTDRVIKAGEGKTGAAYIKARDAAIAGIEKEACADKGDKYRCQVLDFYQGGQYKLYTYRRYKDLRLVAAPEEAMAFFGGDPDNFNFPRYDLDFSFVRLYENGKPVSTPDHLTWDAMPPKAGEAIFVSGNPGTTQRLMTAAELQNLRDHTLPEALVLLSELRGLVIRFSAESPEHERIAKSLLFGVENSFKALTGRQKALIESNVIADKRKEDLALKAKVDADAGLKTEIGDPWTDIAKAIAVANVLRDRYGQMEGGPTGSTLYGYAEALVRAAGEREKPNGERLPGYTDTDLPLIEKRLLDARPVDPELEQMTLTFWLTKLREKLTADAEGTKIFLGKDSPETLAARLVKTKLGDPAVRKALWEGGEKAIAESDDPMIVYYRKVEPAARAILKEYRERVSAVLGPAKEKVAKARFALYGTGIYPDANFSLRLSYGKVAGWLEGETEVAPFTYLGGLWDRATGQDPFVLPPRWVDARKTVDENQVLDFATTNDIIGGNSGSPMITADLKVVGAAFDGNIHSLGGAFFFDETNNRTIGVSTVAILEALRNIYKADYLVKELTGK